MPHKNNVKVTNIKDIADTLTETFSTNSSFKNANKHFLNYKDKTKKKQKQKMNFKLENTESCNGFFALPELKEAIQKSHNTAVSPDEIHYEFLRQLPPKSLDYLLTALNHI